MNNRYFTARPEYPWSTSAYIYFEPDNVRPIVINRDGLAFGRVSLSIAYAASNYKEITQAEAEALVAKPVAQVPAKPAKTDTRFNFKKQRRDKNGKFAPNKPTPKILRAGSLYKLANNEVARYRGNTFDNYLVMSIHGKPVIAKIDELQFAEKPEVENYLAASPKN